MPPSSQPVLISYSGAPSFISSPSWSQIQHAFRLQFPLRNIHWKSATRTSLRTIQELDVSLAHIDTVKDEHASQIPGNLLEKPLLNIYFVNCEDSDVEAYKTSLKKEIKDWHATATARKNQEWLIIQVVKPESKAPTGTFFQLKGVLDKLRSDFNSDKRERCVQLTWSNTTAPESPIVWGEIMNKLKDGLLSAFESALIHREDDVKRSESQRLMPGWNFCTFFILKESLATSFRSMNLLSEALLQYDELEASFFQVLREKNLSWFGTLITPSPKDDSCNLLSVSRKAYRELILANTISVFDFRIYLLARQCEILAKMNRLQDACRRSAAFLGAFGRRLKEVQDTLPPYFIESWTYSSALSVVEKCNSWETEHQMDKTQVASLNAGKGELLELARTQLDIVGVRQTHLPLKPPFSSDASNTSPVVQSDELKEISNADFKKALLDKESFYELYIGVTNRSIDMYAKAGRRKFALKLHGSLAALDIHRGRFDTALATYTSLPAHYAPHKWSSLEGLMLSRALDTHDALEKRKDREWMHVLLSFLATYVEHGTDLLLSKEDVTIYIRDLVMELRKSASELDQDLIHTEHPGMNIKVAAAAQLESDKDGSLLNVVILNRLPCDLPVDDISVALSGPDNVRLKFTAPCTSLPPGKTELTLSCSASLPGLYMLDTTDIRLSRVVFTWAHQKNTAKPQRVKEKQHLVRIPKDYQALTVQVSQPKIVVLGKRSSVQLCVKTGRNEIERLTLGLTSPSATFHTKDAVIDESDNDAEVLKTSDEILIMHIPSHKEVSLFVPHSDVIGPTMKVVVNIQYTTTAEPSITRSISVTQTLLVTLPISVNVEDFFRGTRLFSRFTVSTTSHQHVRIASTTLQSEDESPLKIVSCASKGRGVISVTPNQAADFLFYIDSTEPVRQSLQLLVRYRMLREEVQAIIEEAVDTFVALESDASWIQQYGMTGEIVLPEASLGEGLVVESLEQSVKHVKEILANRAKGASAPGTWREMLIPVDVPSMNILASVHMEIPSKTDVYRFYAGQPIAATLSIHSSFRWDTGSLNEDREYKMQYDVEEMVRDWLVSGRKRGDFVAKENETYTVSLTLIALHHGELSLPKVVVWALPVGGPLTMGSLSIPATETYQKHGAEKILVLPRGGRTTFVTDLT
ncbi:hypothetical protein BDZ89DRAFT_1056144 [Hymenopellis radicata]|nr:hypothetical protein BDZ89DRAFT_1056144 [Hymenopellis radicata]